jgi:hypothetical protein
MPLIYLETMAVGVEQRVQKTKAVRVQKVWVVGQNRRLCGSRKKRQKVVPELGLESPPPPTHEERHKYCSYQ